MTAIGMTILIVGVIAICVGWGSTPKNAKTLGTGVLLILGGMFIGIGGNPAKDMPNGSPPMVMLGVALSVVGVVLLIKSMRKGAEKAKENKAAADTARLVAFYDECVQAGIRECESPRDIQKAQLLADRKGLKYPNGIAALYEEARNAKLGDAEDKKRKEMEELREQERAKHAHLTSYADQTGRNKRIRMLSDQRTLKLAEAERMKQGSLALVQSSQQKEHDWATHGGIASGIAGPAAGVATALDIQAKNAQIRAQNAANLKAMSPIIGAAFDVEMAARKEAERLAAEIERTKVKLVAEPPAAEVLSHLRFRETKTEVSKTGAVTVTTTVVGSGITVFDSEKAVADGTIIAKIYQNGRFIGVAQMVLPVYGVGNHDVKLEGICLKGAEQGVPCTVEFAATNLWAMEE